MVKARLEMTRAVSRMRGRAPNVAQVPADRAPHMANRPDIITPALQCLITFGFSFQVICSLKMFSRPVHFSNFFR